MLTTTSHDSVLLRADDPLIDMNYITSFTAVSYTHLTLPTTPYV